MRFVHGVLIGLKVPQSEYSNHLFNNRELICSYFSYGEGEKKLF